MSDDLVERLREWWEYDHARLIEKSIGRIDELEAQLEKVTAERDEAMREALGLAVTLHRKHYSDVPQWEPLDTPAGVISQIDNMVAGIFETYRAAIPVAYQMALDAGANVANGYGSVACDIDMRDAIRALTPPADLVEQCKKETSHE